MFSFFAGSLYIHDTITISPSRNCVICPSLEHEMARWSVLHAVASPVELTVVYSTLNILEIKITEIDKRNTEESILNHRISAYGHKAAKLIQNNSRMFHTAGEGGGGVKGLSFLVFRDAADFIQARNLLTNFFEVFSQILNRSLFRIKPTF